MKKTQRVKYYRKIDSVMLHYLMREKIRHYVLAYLLCTFVVYVVIEECQKEATVLAIPRRLIQFCCSILIVKKKEILCAS